VLGTAPSWRARARTAGLAAAALGFWWGATGVLLALQRSAGTRAIALAVAGASAAAGLALAARARREAGAAGGARAVLGGALLWTAVSAAFYGGWVVGPPVIVPVAAGDAPSLARAVAAIAATAHSSALSAGLLACAVALARRPGRVAGAAPGFAPGAFAVLWGAHELAKLNVFFGVANGGAELLPAYLAPLRGFFGPARNAWLLAPSAAVLGGAAVAAGLGAARAAAGARRAGFALVAGVLALAALEHVLLGVASPVTWWDAFLRWRGAV
jgi:putative photosynthetic complex assembly protein 2